MSYTLIRKEVKLKTVLTILTAIVLSVLAGCNGTVEEKKPLALGKGRKLLSVDFQKGQTLRYKFVSHRDIEVDWTAMQRARAGKGKVDKSFETMEMVVAYKPIEVDPYGLATIKANCETVIIKRSPRKDRRPHAKDAARNFTGRTFTFTVGPTGKIEDYSQLEKLIRNVGQKAFQVDIRRGKIKDPDMIGDFTATQWFLWDSICSIEKATEGVRVGQSWKSKLSVPLPMVLQKARDVTYTLDKIRRTPEGQLAVIASSYSLAESAPRSWPMPYPDGRFQMRGRFGFLRGYKVLDLQGSGEEVFNITAGRTERYNQQYRIKFDASLPMGLDASPRITIEQKLTMQLIE